MKKGLGGAIMASVLEVLLTGWIDPLVWIKSMKAAGVRKSKLQCRVAFILMYTLIIVKGCISEYAISDVATTIMNVLIAGCCFGYSIYLLSGKVRNKILYVAVFLFILSSTELIVVGLYTAIAQETYLTLLDNGIKEKILFILIKPFQAFLCYCFYGKGKSLKFFEGFKEKVLMVTISVICIVILISGALASGGNRRIIWGVSFLAMLSLCFAYYILITWAKLERKEKEIGDLKHDINNNEDRKEIVKGIIEFEEKLPLNMFIMKNLLYHQEYDKLGEYMKETFAGIEKADILYEHSNITIRILVSGLLQKAKDLNIPLSVRLHVQDFKMDDEDICSLIQNLVNNGLEAAEKVPREKHVSLQAVYREVGYEIICINDCVGKADFSKTSKEDKINHGLGCGIIDKVVDKYHGVITREWHETEREDIGVVVISVRFCLA